MYSNCSFRLTNCLSNAMSFIIHYPLPQTELCPNFNSFNKSVVERVLRILWGINNDPLKLSFIKK